MSKLINNQKTRSVIVSPTLFDGATIIDSSGADAGFPVTNLQDFQAKRRWHHSPGGDPIQTYFIVDLGASAPGRAWNCAIPLFHNSFVGPFTNRWRVQTGNDTSGTGFYDSGFMPLWASPTPVDGGSNNYQSTAFYRDRGLGAHSHFILPRSAAEFGTFLHFETGGQVNFGDVLDPALNQVSVLARIRLDPGQPPWTAMTIAQKGISNVLTGSTLHGGGFSLALRRISTSATVVATVNDGVTAYALDAFDAAGVVLQSGWNEIGMAWNSSQDLLRIWLNGATVATVSTPGAVPIPDTTNPFRIGFNSVGSQSMNLVDVERLAVTEDPFFGGAQARAEWEGLFTANLRQITVPDIVRALYPIDSGLGTVVEDIGPSGFDGTMSGDVNWNTEGGTPVELFNRYARFDFESSNTPTWTLGRFYMGLALEPITPYGTSMPTPVGTPPKPQTSWIVRLTRERFESIAYALAADTGNNPDVLRSWGHDTHLIDGGKPVVSVNNIDAEFPWQRQQQTVYGYIASLDEIATSKSGLVDARLTVRGM